MDTKKKKTIKITSILAIILVLLSVIGISIYKQNEKILLQEDPEIIRTMQYDEVQNGDENTNSPYVQFDAFFLRDLNGDGYTESVRGTCKDISETDTLYMNINVLTNGTFKNGKITINKQNINLQTAIVEDNIVKQDYISNNTTTLELKDMVNGTQKLMYGTVKASDFRNDITKYSKVNSITLTGTHVADDGTETQVSKTVDFTVDWHGDIQTNIYNQSGAQYIDNITDGENVELSFYVTTKENINELILKNAGLEGVLPEINGYEPISVETTSNDVDFNYNKETRTFTIKKESVLGSNGIVSNTVSDYNTFTINVTYPYAVYESLLEKSISLNIPIKAYYEGYNNTNPEFINPITSIEEKTITLLWREPNGVLGVYDVTIGEYRSYDGNYVISKEEPLKLYNNIEDKTKDQYIVEWETYISRQGGVDSIQMKEAPDPYSDRFLNNVGTYFNMSDYVKNIGIYFTGAEDMLGENGYINVINDETGEIIHKFTKADWEIYNSSNPYIYESPIKHIRIETSKVNEYIMLHVYNVKEIDDSVLVNRFTREEFDKLQNIYTYLKINIKEDGRNYTGEYIDSALYEAPASIATLTVNRDTIGTQKKEENINLEIKTESEYNIKGWKNGKFIIELPKEILDVEINEVNISNSNVKILAYAVFENNGQKFIRVETENENEEDYTIKINTDLTADSMAVTQTKDIKLYGYNEACDNYKTSTQDIYDIDGDENLTENINYATDSLSLVSPTSLLTNQQATDYNKAQETVIAPQIAIIDKTEADTATIKLNIANNYEQIINEVTILGKIPFKGNTFSINGTDLGSNFTTQMLSGGITVPDDLKDKITIYYSENENPTNDINNLQNGWTKTPDFSKVKTFLIDFEDYVFQVGESKQFSYKIKVPSTVQYNDVSYSTHAVYFNLNTDQGQYKTQTETSKLGFKIERKYNFNIQKLKENTDVPIQGATFSITADGESETIIETTNNSGNISIENLYVDKTYTLKEIRTPDSYENIEGDIQFKVSVENNELVLNILQGGELLKSYNIEQATTDSRGIINFTIENTPKYKIEITKKDQDNGTVIQGVKYKLEGEGLGEGIIATTNREGKLVFTNLHKELEYTLTEIEAEKNGYYINEIPVKFKLENNGGKLNLVVIRGSFANNLKIIEGTSIDAQDKVIAELTDKKIPTYKVQLKKYGKDGDITLKGAQYKIIGEGLYEEGKIFTTDDQGILTIPDLYEYVAGKEITGVYTLKEIIAPEGYTLDERELKFRATRNEQGNLELEILGENFLRGSSITNAESEDAIINIELGDKPLFKLTKVDGQTKTPIPNTKFIIYEIDENYNELGYAKDINGKEVGILEDGVPVVETNGNGEISYGLKAGLYKAVEIKAPEKYELPEDEEDRTYYFGIDASKEQEFSFGTSIMNQVSGINEEKIESVDETLDKGFVISGYFVDSADFDKDGISDIKGNSSKYSGFIAKYGSKGNLEFAKSVYTSDGEVKLHKVIQTNDGGYVTVGYYTGNTLIAGDVNTGLTNTGANKKALVIKFGISGNYEWSKEVEKSGIDVDATAVKNIGQSLQENIIVGIKKAEGKESSEIFEYSNLNGSVINNTEIPYDGSYSDKMIGIEEINDKEVIIVDGDIIYTYENGTVIEKYDTVQTAPDTSVKYFEDIARLKNGKYVIVGETYGREGLFLPRYYSEDYIIIYDVNSNTYEHIDESIYSSGQEMFRLTSVKSTIDGGYIVGGYTNHDLDINNSIENLYISGESDGFIIKYSEDGTPEWVKQVSGDGYDEVTDVIERDENEFIAVGDFNSTSVKADTSDSSSLSLTQDTDSFIFNYGEIVTAPGIPETLEITVNNNLKKYKITTDIEEVNGVKGGSISGEDQAPYEIVEYGKDSTKEIKITPNTGYNIAKITINGENCVFATSEDGTVTLPSFTNMTEDKHIVVTFSNTQSSVIVHHYIDGTETQVAPDEILNGNIGEYYTTAPKMDLEKYELKKDGDGNYQVPDNASGTYTKEQQVITYYYVKKQSSITVKHLIEGTDERVPLDSGEPAQDEILTGEIGTNYTTDALTSEELSPKYELLTNPYNQNGIYTNEKTDVIYYYKVKNVKVSTEVKTHKETNEAGEEIAVKGGSISGEGQTSYEIIKYGEDSLKDIIITPYENYQIKEILINDEPTEYSPDQDGTVILDKFIDITEDKHIVVEFEKIPATVIVHHYIENTTDKVPSVVGGVVEDETKQGVVGDTYNTKIAENIAPNYEYVSTQGQISGKMTKDTIVVIYYYKLKDPNIETPVITKESSLEKVTNVGQAIDYTVNYNAIINTYKGDATITIVDTLPYEIDEVESSIAGGVYNKDSKTITWTEEISNIDTFTNGAKQVNITKEIILVYKDVNTAQNSISNKVTGKVELKTPEKEETVEDEKEISAEYFINIPVNKIWNDNNNEAGKRPNAVNIVIKNGTEEVAKQELNNSNNWTYTFENLPKYDNLGNAINYTVEEKEVNSGDLYFYDTNISGSITSGYTITNTFEVPGETVSVDVSKVWVDTEEQQDKRPTGVTVILKNGDKETGRQELNIINGWSYKFTNLPKYDNLGNKVNYTVEEVTTNKFYTSHITGDMTNGYTITNTFTVPNETVDVSVTKVWNDNGNTAGKRPTNVTLTVTGNGQTKEHTLSGVMTENEWSYTFEDLAKYDKNGNEINYTVDEAELENMFYTKENVTGDITNGYTITNTFEVPGETVSVDVSKVWIDTEEQEDKRPTGVTVILKNGDTEAGRQELNSSNGWTYTFTNLPKYDNLGNEVNYTVEEVTTNKFYTSSITGDMTNGYTITNTFTVPNETVDKTVTKIWNHGGNKEEKPQEITLQIKNGDEVVAEETVNEEDGWKYTFEDLPKYDENGNEINYTADEKESLEEYNKEIEGLTVTNTYKGAVITASKLARTEKNNGYVVAGEKITYTIVVRNTGGLAKEVEVKDQAPEGTTFVEGSIKVDNIAQENLTETDLQNGIRVNVPAKGANGEDGETRVSFEVTVNEGVTGEIKNAGTIKESETIEEETNEVTTPVVKISKTAEVERKTESTLGVNEVTVGDEITYKIKVENTSGADKKDIEIEDIIPEGTSLKQINNNGVQEGNKIKWQIDVDKNSSMEVSFVVTVEYEGKDTSIKNVATVDGNKTNETENPYKKQESTVESSITKEGEEKITTPDEAVYYEINYTATVEDHVGNAKVTILDKLPYEIIENESELNGGTYDTEARTITWEEDITNIDTYKANESKKITITKAISLKYDYGNIDEIGASVRNEVEGKIELKEGDEITKTDTVTGEHTEKVEIPARVIVHHYIYDEETGTYTEEKIAADEEKEGIVGESYTTTKSSSVPQNYECINETPEKYKGKMTYEDIEITYYYKLKESSITSTIEKTATANKVIDGIPVLTDEKDQVTYKIKNNTQINDYIGKATIIVTDNLPAQIDEAKSDLQGGIYNEEDSTITWKEEVDVDTFTNGVYTYNFDKTIKLVYVNQHVTEDLVNEVRGETKLYYPDNYPEKGGEEVKTDEKEETATVKQEYKVDKKVEKIWEDNNDIKEKRPNSVLVELTADGEVVENTQVELNSKNGWEHTYRDLEKYDEYGQEIEYSIIEEEKNEGDLEYYEEPEINGEENIIVTNRYKLKETALDSDITKETQAVITASNQEVPYTIHYEAQIDEYIGEALVTIVDELPYKIDEEKSNLDGGVYNEELQTITWKEELGHINTDTMGEAYRVDVTKNIVLVYKDLDVTESMVTNKVKGTVELYETEEKNTVETEENTQVEVEGTVLVKYVEKESGKELETVEEIKGRVGEEYITLAKDIENYTLVGDTENTRGKYKEGTIEVIYYYEKTPAKVIIKYQDEEGKDLIEEKVVEGYVSEEYETKAEEIEGYELVDVIGQESGVMTEEDIVITYVYKKKEAGGVRVEYIEKSTGEKIAEDETIKGKVGDKYKIERKVIENYQKADPEPTNKEGTMTEEEIVVTYYYEKIPSGILTVKYVDKDTNEEITYIDEKGEEKTYGCKIIGRVGDKYKTEEKEIPYYKIVENILPVNREGILSQNDETVIYYYEKMSFNMEISKNIKTITIKGEEREVNNGSLSKVEIHRKEITTTPVEIKYVITVRNTGEIDGKGEVIEKIPEGFEVSSNNPKEWVINADGTMKYAVELKAGESKDIEVVLKWQASETNFGEKKNIALLNNVENPAGFEEENTGDNQAEATVIVTVATGKEISILIIVLGFIASAGSLVLCYEYELYRKERNQPVRMVKLDGKNVVIKKEEQK